MGYNARNDEIRDNITRMKREWEAQRDALATVRRFNARLSAKGYSWFWPKVATEHYSLQNLKLRILTCLDCAAERAKEACRIGGQVRLQSVRTHVPFQCSRFRSNLSKVPNGHGPRCRDAPPCRAQHAAKYLCLLLLQVHTNIHAAGHS